MAKQVINTGTAANSKNGDPLRTAFTKINANFTELYTLTGGTSADLKELAQDYAKDMFTTGTHTSITATYDDAGNKLNLALDASNLNQSLIPSINSNGTTGFDLGSSSRQWRSLYVSNNTIYIGGTAVGVDPSGQLTVGGSGVTAGSVAWANVTGKPTIPTGDRLVLGASRLVLSDEGASRLSLYNSNTEKSRIQQNVNDLLLSSLSGGVTLSAIDGAGGDWYFNTSGELVSSGGKFLSSPEVNAVFGSKNSTLAGSSSGTVTIKSGTGIVDGGSIYIEAGTGGSGNDGEVVIRTGSTPYEWSFDNGGILTVPGAINLGTDARIYGLGDFIGLLASPNSSAGLEIDGVNDAILAAERHVIIRSDSGTTNKNWTFDENGSLSVPGSIANTAGPLELSGRVALPGRTNSSVYWDGGSVYSQNSQVAFRNSSGIGMLIDGGNSPNSVDLGNNSSGERVRLLWGAGTVTGNSNDIEFKGFGSAISITPNNSSGGSFKFNSNGSLTLPSSSSINASASASLTAGTGANLGNLEDTWISNEIVWITERDQDAQIIAPATRPWAGMSSYDAYPVMIAYTAPGGVLPTPSNFPPLANSAKNAHTAWQTALATVNGVKLTSGAKDWQFTPTGVLELPGAVQLKVYANTEERDLYIETPVAGMMVMVGTSTQIYNGSTWRTLSYV